MKRRNIFGIAMGIIVVICILMAMVKFKKEQIAQSEVDAAQKEDVTVLPGGITIKKVDDDEDYDTSKNYYKDYDDTGLETYVISGVFSDEETYIKGIREADICEYIYKNEDGNADVKVTEEQRKTWIGSAKENIEYVLDKVKDDEESNFEISEDYTELNVKITKQSSPSEFLSNVEVLLYNAEIIQVFTGEKDWSVHFIVQNMNTGYELVNVQYPQEGWNIDEDTWDE